jgi:hypothetical protein
MKLAGTGRDFQQFHLLICASPNAASIEMTRLRNGWSLTPVRIGDRGSVQHVCGRRA